MVLSFRVIGLVRRGSGLLYVWLRVLDGLIVCWCICFFLLLDGVGDKCLVAM